MYIRKLHLSQFRSHVDTTLELQPLTIIRGGNAVGKSSLEMALELSLTNRAEGTATDGKGSAGLIRVGEAKAMITMALQENGEERILRTALNGPKKTTLVTKSDDPSYSGGADYLSYLEMHREVLSCLFNNRRFVDYDEAKQKNVLAAIILPKSYEWEEWVKPAVHEAELALNWSKLPLEIIDQAYDLAFKARTDANRDVNNFAMPEGDISEAENLKAYTDRLAERQAQLAKAQKDKATAESDAKHAEATRKAAQECLTAAQVRLALEQGSVVEFKGRILSSAQIKAADAIAKSSVKAEALDKYILRYDVEISANKEALAKINKLSDEAVCPTCGTAITEETVAAIAGPLMKARGELAQHRQQAIDERKSLGNPAEAKRSVEAHKQAESELAKTKARIADEMTAIRDAQAAIDGAAVQSVDTSEVDALIAELQGKIQRCNEAIAVARSAAELKVRKETDKARLANLQKRQQLLEKLVKYFEPKGIKSKLLAGSIGGFTDAMNGVLANWGYQCELSIEPYRFEVKFGERAIALKFLSKSQRYRFSVAFQVALAIQSGFKIVVIDESDILDPKIRRGFFEALTTAGLDQVIILGTDVREQVPDLPGTVFYFLEDVAAEGKLPVTAVRKLVA